MTVLVTTCLVFGVFCFSVLRKRKIEALVPFGDSGFLLRAVARWNKEKKECKVEMPTENTDVGNLKATAGEVCWCDCGQF